MSERTRYAPQTLRVARFRDAAVLTVVSVNRMPEVGPPAAPMGVSRAGILLDGAAIAQASRRMDESFTVNAALADADECAQFRDVDSWSDAKLIAAVRRDPPDEAALNALVDRYWKPLFARCQVLALNHQKAGDLAQEAWCRVLRARRMLIPDGNFPAYLMTVATNLWRDSHRSARRAGPLAEHRLASLDAALAGEESEAVSLVDILPDLNALQAAEQARLKLDIDAALERLPPLLREVLVARYITGESAAEIGQRYGRTEQTASGWVREALRQMKAWLEDANCVTSDGVEK